ncbi:DUF6188 domain-containing protein [Paenibacillus sediminis]|uniref:Uncharacterized protein n=1 Tax=Paenibacillus sediminis TaxID=664909 RepID=A0ABS4H8S7_9BACL|nr:DUF6188 family protein [Paenibacillus sediminis]MBP1938677.1 hypothetical protein [Paenibacillus sediminis]
MNRTKSNINFSQFLNQRVTEINRVYPIITFETGFLTIECSWRLRKGNSIIVGNAEIEVEDRTDKAYVIFEEALLNNTILDVTHFEEISDLTVTFDNNIYLDVFHESSLYEGWQLSGAKGFLLVATPGGSYALAN